MTDTHEPIIIGYDGGISDRCRLVVDWDNEDDEVGIFCRDFAAELERGAEVFESEKDTDTVFMARVCYQHAREIEKVRCEYCNADWIILGTAAIIRQHENRCPFFHGGDIAVDQFEAITATPDIDDTHPAVPDLIERDLG